jgi:endoglycosylceramidase
MMVGSVWLRLGAGGLVMAGLGGCHSSASTSPPPADAAATKDASPTAAPCTITPPVPSDWRLVADGTTFRDRLGRVVFLRGVDGGGRSKFAPYVPFDFPDGGYQQTLDSYIAHAASWGIDVMRVPFTWAALEPTEGTDNTSWLAMYDALLDAAWAKGIWTVLDFHQDLYSEVLCGDGFPGWTVPDAGPPAHDCADWSLSYFNNPGVVAAFDRFWDGGAVGDAGAIQPAYLAAWDVMVARYKDKPGVLGFEPINEPSSGSANENNFEATTLTAFYSSIVPHMRAEAPTSLVFIDPPGVDGATVATKMGKPSGDGIVFAPHYYPVSSSSADPQADLVAWQTIGQTWNVPVFLGEFGTGDQADVLYMESVFDALDLLSMSGSEWEYSVAAEEWNFETFGLVAPDGGEYPVAQAVQRPYARAVAGSAIMQAFLPSAEDDGGSKGNTFTLSFTPSAGVTEVAIPANLYPTGYDIELTGACVDATSAPGRLLVQPDVGATTVSLTITTK